MSTRDQWTGRCLCGAVRYAVRARPLNTSLCHCEDCRRASGAPCQGWVFFPKDGFELLAGKLRSHCYEGRERTFCAWCGSPVTFVDQSQPRLIEVTLGTIDQAAELKPDDYNWMEDHLSWLVLDPSLPKFTHNGPVPCLT